MRTRVPWSLVAGLLVAAGLGCDERFTFEADAGVAPPGGAPTGEIPQAARCTVAEGCGATGLSCQPTALVCVACQADTDCTAAGASRCDTGEGRCVECLESSHCGVGQRCDTVTRRCGRPCNDNDQCPESLYRNCDKDIGFCVECKEDEHCAGGPRPFCELASGKCVACAVDGHCGGATPRCDRTRGTCVACLGPADCTEATPHCDTRSGSCVTR